MLPVVLELLLDEGALVLKGGVELCVCDSAPVHEDLADAASVGSLLALLLEGLVQLAMGEALVLVDEQRAQEGDNQFLFALDRLRNEDVGRDPRRAAPRVEAGEKEEHSAEE